MPELPTTTDVAIIGAGFAGAATAWALSRRGIPSVILEREPAPGRYASGRSAGLGRQLAEDDATSRLTLRGAEALRGPLAATWQPCGGILSFDQPAAAETYRARAERLGVPVTVLDRDAVLARWPGADELPIVSALLVPSDGIIDVTALLAAFLTGATVVCDTRVERIEPTPTGVRLGLARGTLDARVVVDATGAWAGELTGDPPLESFKRHVYLLEAEPIAGAPFLWHLGADELYLRGAGDELLVSPCDATATAPADQQPDSIGDAMLHVRLSASAWGTARVTRRWACQRAFTANRTMRLGRDPARPWLIWAAGLGGHGATAAAAVGEVVADACAAALTAR